MSNIQLPNIGPSTPNLIFRMYTIDKIVNSRRYSVNICLGKPGSIINFLWIDLPMTNNRQIPIVAKKHVEGMNVPSQII